MTARGFIYPDGFEWDEAKNRANLEKHGIDFAEARHIFDGFVHSEVDDRMDYGEVREVGYGIAAGQILTVVFTRRGDVQRIISARRSRTDERRKYREAEERRQI